MPPVTPRLSPAAEVEPRAATPTLPSGLLQHRSSSSSISSDTIRQGSNELNRAILDHYSRQIFLELTDGKIPETQEETVEHLQHAHAHNKPHGTEILAQIHLKGGFGIDANPKLAQTLFEQAASHGLALSEYKVGKAFLKQAKPAPFKAVDWLQRASKQGFTKADYRLGMLHLYGEGDFPTDPFQALESFTNAADGGLKKAQYELGNLYELGILGEPLPDIAIPYHAAAAQQNHTGSLYRLGVLVANEDRHSSAMWLTQAANQGHPEALEELLNQAEKGFLSARRSIGLMHLDGRNGLSQDDREARAYLTEPAKKGDPEAQAAMAKLHFENRAGLRHDDAIENTYLKSAARQKNADAQEMLGIRHLNGTNGIPQDHRHAYALLHRAAMNGRKDAQYHVGNMYRDGLGVARSTKRASYWHNQAAEQKHKLAEYEVHFAHEATLSGTPEYTDEMRTWLLNSATEGLPEAQYRLGEKSATGKDGFAMMAGGTRYWFKKAADQGHAQATYRLAEVMEGDTQPNYSAIKNHYLKAAELGHRNAPFKLGSLFHQGQGNVVKDQLQAAIWLRKALELGDSDALPMLEQLAEEKVPEALCIMGHAHLNGEHGKTKDPYKAFELFKQAARAEHLESKYQSALIHMTGLEENEAGQSMKQNDEIANELLHEAATLGYAPAQVKFALRHLGPDADSHEKQIAVEWIRAAADQNNKEGLYYLGSMHDMEENGYGVAHDPILSDLLRRKSAHLGYAPAQFSIAIDHSKSKVLSSSEEDDEEAVHWHKLAAAQKYAASQYELAMFQRQGRGGLENDDEQVFDLLLKSAQQDHQPAKDLLEDMGLAGVTLDAE